MSRLSNLSPEQFKRMGEVFRINESEKAKERNRLEDEDEERNRLEDEERKKLNAPAQITKIEKQVAPQSEPSNLQVSQDLKAYIQVGINGIHGKPAIISPFEVIGYNHLTYENTNFKLIENGLYMPPPRIFGTHFNNVLEAKQGKRKLHYADGQREVEQSLVEEMYEHMTTNFKDVYRAGRAGAWTWLNAKFVEGNGFNNMNLETITGIKNGQLESTKERLLECLNNSNYFDLKFNSQGLADKGSESAKQDYSKGQNMYFSKPVLNFVARFNANSGGADLLCNWVTISTNPGLGVYACAEGTASQKISGERK